MLEALLAGLARGERRALSALLTRCTRGEAAAIGAALPPGPRKARAIAVTGSAGVGKSSFLGALLPRVRAAGLTAAVLACDPQSPRTGGALLGDRLRMGDTLDDGLFIRSLVVASGSGAIAPHLDVMVRLLEAFGFDLVFIETVGAGQGDVDVAAVADTLVLLVQPESGDELQWEKAGVIELADVIVVHKADLPSSADTVKQLAAMLHLSDAAAPPVLAVSSRTGEGLDAVLAALKLTR